MQFLLLNLIFWLSVDAALNISNTLAIINNLRATHNSYPVKWDTTLEATALNWAINLNTTNTFKHSNSPYGENLAYIKGAKNETYIMEKSISIWYAESLNYNYLTGGFTAGHFTQLVWNNTKYIGAAIVNGYVVMEFNPPGNIEGQYIKNVMLPVLWPMPASLSPLPPLPPLPPLQSLPYHSLPMPASFNEAPSLKPNEKSTMNLYISHIMLVFSLFMGLLFAIL